MRIAFLSSAHPGNDKRVYDKQAAALAAAGHEVSHIHPVIGQQPPATDAPALGIKLVPYLRGDGWRGRIVGLKTLARLARNSDADCFHCNEVDSWIVALLLTIPRRRIVVFDVHEHYPSRITESRLPTFLKKPGEWLLRSLFKWGGRRTDAIVFAKDSVAPDFRHANTRKVTVANYARLSANAASQVASLSTNDPARVRIIHLGLFGRKRGWPQVLNAMAMVSDSITLTVVGAFDDGSDSDFFEMVTRLDLAGRVTHTSWLPFDEAYELVRSADIGLVAFQPGYVNHVYALPHKLFDYMLACLPVIVPQCAIEVCGIVNTSQCGLVVDTSDPAAIANAFAMLAEDACLRRQFGRNGRRAVLSQYNWESEAAKLIALYEELGKSRR